MKYGLFSVFKQVNSKQATITDSYEVNRETTPEIIKLLKSKLNLGYKNIMKQFACKSPTKQILEKKYSWSRQRNLKLDETYKTLSRN